MISRAAVALFSVGASIVLCSLLYLAHFGGKSEAETLGLTGEVLSAQHSPMTAAEESGTAPVTRKALSIHVGPDERYVIVGLLPPRAQIQIVGRDASGAWLAIALGTLTDLYGWIRASEVTGKVDLQALAVKPVKLLPQR